MVLVCYNLSFIYLLAQTENWSGAPGTETNNGSGTGDNGDDNSYHLGLSPPLMSGRPLCYCSRVSGPQQYNLS